MYITEFRYNIFMKFIDLVKERDLSIYELSKITGVPYSTLSDIAHHKTKINNVTLSNALKISNALEMKVEELLSLEEATVTNFYNFRERIINTIKTIGIQRFTIRVIKNKEIDFYYKNGALEHALYLLATIDYLSRKVHLTRYTKRYNAFRKLKLDYILFSSSELISFSSIQEAEQSLAIKIEEEFKRHNIVEIELPTII